MAAATAPNKNGTPSASPAVIVLYASAGGGAHGLRLAMTVGAVVQGLCVALGWRVMGAADGADRRVD